ncbi:MAG: DUF2341 domain-containing protein [Promethearchaeota archaeon]
MDDTKSFIQMSSSGPPNKHFFKYFKIITINHDMVSGTGSHINFPVLISILDSDLQDHVSQSNGNDIAFANDTDWLDHEIEFFNQTYNSTHAQLIGWVRIPSLSTIVNATIFMYYGNSTMSSRQNPTGVWDASYRGVWHLSELSGSSIDSTSYDNSGDVLGTVSRGAMGQIDGAYDFENNGQINLGDPIDGHLDMGTKSFTISFWMNINDSTGSYQYPLYKGASTGSDTGYDFETNLDATSLSFRICDGTDLRDVSGFEITHDSWAYVTGVVNRSLNYMYLYKNGSQVGSTNISSIEDISNTISLLTPHAFYGLNGLLDEIRICSIAHTAGWILTEYNNQVDPRTFFSFSSEIIIDIIPPFYSDLIESSDPLELGVAEVIKINVSDPSGILQVKIQFEGLNNSMVNIGGNTWQYDNWIPNFIGNYTYMIYMQDNLNNLNSTIGTIEVIDTTPPIYSNLIESSDPLELGQTEVIQININDLAGIFQVKIEYEGLNHSMTNIGGNTWQYNSWIPNNWIVYQYKIHMGDNNGNWNTITNTITVHDTLSPSPPILTNAPSGDISGNVVFDWLDGSDPSGISTYRLIIDNEIDPFTTPGVVFEINITNTGLSSSYYEFTESLRPGTYYFCLWQIDGAGHQSSASMGSFTIRSSSQPFPFWIIFISIIIISVLASLTVRSYVILPRKRRKESELLARTQRFKDLRNIQAIIIIHNLSGVPIFSRSYSILEKNQNELFSGFIQAITTVSEEFSENKAVDTEMVEKIIELDLKHFKCLITDEEDVRVAFVLKQKTSERLKSQIRAFIVELNLNLSEELENWDGSLDKFQSLIPSILNEYFELYYKGPFIITDAASRAKICKDHELSSMEKYILSIIDSIMKDETSFHLDKIIELVAEQNKNLVIDALESLIKEELILPTDK